MGITSRRSSGPPGRLHGKLLILHGVIDDNVSFRNTMRFVEALQEANKDFELMVYPSSRHGIFGQHYTRIQLDFIRRTLGDPKPQKPVSPGEVATGGEDDSATIPWPTAGGRAARSRQERRALTPTLSRWRGRRIRAWPTVSSRYTTAPAIEHAFEAGAVDVQGEQNLADLAHGYLVLERPLNDVEILAAVLEVIDDRVDQRRGLEGRSQQTEITMIELDPERLTLEVLEPAMSQEATPVLADPRPDGRLAQVTPRLLAFDPLELQGFFFGALLETHTTSGRVVHDGYRSTTLRHRDLQAELRNHSFGISHGKLSLSTKTSARAVFRTGTKTYGRDTPC